MSGSALGASLSDLLAMVTFGMLPVRIRRRNNRNGADYLARLPLQGLDAPAHATADALARPIGDGIWDIRSMTLPAAGRSRPALQMARSIAFSIGAPSRHGRVDPTLTHPSFFGASSAMSG